MTHTSFIEWLCHERNCETADGARRVRADLMHGARIVEKPAFDSPAHRRYLLGKACFLMQHPVDTLDTVAEHVGYGLEADDFQLAVIALRRQSARGH